MSHDLTSKGRQAEKATWLPWPWLDGAQLESASKASMAGRQMPPRACWKRAQKLSLAEQRLRQVVKCRLRGRLQLSTAQASMPRNAQFHKRKAPALGEPNLCKWAFANTCRTKLCWHLRIQCQGMPSFKAQGPCMPLHRGTESVQVGFANTCRTKLCWQFHATEG